MTFRKIIMRLSPSRLAISGLILTIIGLVGLVPVVFSSEFSPVAAQSDGAVTPTQIIKQEPAPSPSVTIGHPARIEVPSVGIDLPVIDGNYDAKSGNWTLTPDKAQFAGMTTEPNTQAGQTFIYGHATQRVFGKLLKLQVGQQVYVTTSNGYKFTYTLKETQVVSPTNTGILAYTGSPRLLLQTCVGVWSENRKFFILEFTSVQKV